MPRPMQEEYTNRKGVFPVIRFWVVDLVVRAIVGAFVVLSILGVGTGEAEPATRDADATGPVVDTD